MTNEMMNVRSLVEKSAEADLLREMIGFAAERLMELEVGTSTGADFGEKNPMRLAQRNGYCDRDWRRARRWLSSIRRRSMAAAPLAIPIIPPSQPQVAADPFGCRA